MKQFNYKKLDSETLDEYFDRVIDESFVNMGWDDKEHDLPENQNAINNILNTNGEQK